MSYRHSHIALPTVICLPFLVCSVVPPFAAQTFSRKRLLIVEFPTLCVLRKYKMLVFDDLGMKLGNQHCFSLAAPSDEVFTNNNKSCMAILSRIRRQTFPGCLKAIIRAQKQVLLAGIVPVSCLRIKSPLFVFPWTEEEWLQVKTVRKHLMCLRQTAESSSCLQLKRTLNGQ